MLLKENYSEVNIFQIPRKLLLYALALECGNKMLGNQRKLGGFRPVTRGYWKLKRVQ
jgi:hypothetical protein